MICGKRFAEIAPEIWKKVYQLNKNNIEQAGAELGQAQPQLA